MSDPPKFRMLNASSKFAICGLPLRVDSYKTCPFGCVYCFANNRKIMEFDKHLQIGNVPQLRRTVERVKKDGPRERDFVDNLLDLGITWHCGGMSDPFQPAEGRYHVTRDLMELTSEHGIHVLFSTKTDTLRGCEPDPALHTFQLSVTNVDRPELEPNVPPLESRVRLFHQLKDAGFRVGIRLQPFIPGVSDERVVELFDGADQFTIEGLKLVPQNAEHVRRVLDMTGLDKRDFKQMGLLNLRPEIRAELYQPIVEALEYHSIPWSIADNDMHEIGRCSCCCGDALVDHASGFDSTATCAKHGTGYTLDDVLSEIPEQLRGCKVNQLFTSNRQEGCVTVEDFYRKRFSRKTSPFSPRYLWHGDSAICGQPTEYGEVDAAC